MLIRVSKVTSFVTPFRAASQPPPLQWPGGSNSKFSAAIHDREEAASHTRVSGRQGRRGSSGAMVARPGLPPIHPRRWRSGANHGCHPSMDSLVPKVRTVNALSSRYAVDSACRRPDETAKTTSGSRVSSGQPRAELLGLQHPAAACENGPGDHVGIAHRDVGKPAMRGVVAVKMRCASFMAIASHSCRRCLTNPYTAVSAARRTSTLRNYQTGEWVGGDPACEHVSDRPLLYHAWRQHSVR